MIIIDKIKKKLNNRGSSIIMVIVSVAFVAVIVGALLSAAAYAYRLKLVNKNAKDNFYYVEQAMQEIYAGVGEKTVKHMYDAYTTTIENMVYYDLNTASYTTLSNDEANAMFRRLFMDKINSDPYFNYGDEVLAQNLANYISNNTVWIDDKALHVKKTPKDGPIYTSICLQNITLTRTQDYKNNAGSGTYTQTITADIEISQPDFEINFDNTSTDYSNIFDFALIGDMGIEINQGVDKNITITGNVYASSDYYNKAYNKDIDDGDMFKATSDATSVTKTTDKSFSYNFNEKGTNEEGAEVTLPKSISYTHGAVSNKSYSRDEELKDSKLYFPVKNNIEIKKYFDGVNPRSMYSGIYINNSNVAIAGDMVVVPGTIAVMNDSDLSIYNKENGTIGISEVWTDNIVLGGYGEKVDTTTAYKAKAPSAYLSANVYVRDDTELNAERSTLTLRGSYYGYGNSTEKDTRVFVPAVTETNFKVPALDEDGKEIVDSEGNKLYVNRDHYNSSAIVVNGQNSTLDLSKASTLYLAGRAYVELSKNVTYNSEDGKVGGEGSTDGSVYVTADGQLTDTASNNTEVITEKYDFDGTVIRDKDNNIIAYVNDYKTGESLSVKSNQVAYAPITADASPSSRTVNGNTYLSVQLGDDVAGVEFFKDYFPADVFGEAIVADPDNYRYYVPVLCITTSDEKEHYYYDLDTAYELVKKSGKHNNDEIFKNADVYSAGFISSYVAASSNDESALYNKLRPVEKNADFKVGEILLSGGNNDGADTTMYSSGAITTNNATKFSMIVEKDLDAINSEETWKSLLTTADSNKIAQTESTLRSVLNFSKNISTEYLYVKWNLDHFEDSENTEMKYIDEMFAEGSGWTESMITPINRYLVFNNIKEDTHINPSNLPLVSGYKVWVDSGDLTLGSDDSHFVLDNEGQKTSVIKGIVITKGDVRFHKNVTRFEGLIVAGGKIYIGDDGTGNADISTGYLMNITASPEICRSILRECMQLSAKSSSELSELAIILKAQDFRNVFRQYQYTPPVNCPYCGGKIDNTTNKCEDAECKYNASLDTTKVLVNVNELDYTDICSIDNWTKSVE